jgi:hypothetical protein
MKVILIDDHGDTREIQDNDGPLQSVMDEAKENGFAPCGICGRVAFDDEYNYEQDYCKYCALIN